MLKIKLARLGKKNQPHYRIVVNEARDKRDGSVTDTIGHYIPSQTPKVLEIDAKKYQEWIKKGAQPTDTVAALYQRSLSDTPFPQKKAKPSKKALAKAKAEAEVNNTPTTEKNTTPTTDAIDATDSKSTDEQPTDAIDATDSKSTDEQPAVAIDATDSKSTDEQPAVAVESES